MRTLHRLPLAIVLAVALGFGLAGCDEEEDAARIVVDVVSLNQNAPLMSDIYDMNNTPEDPEDDFVPVDVVEVTFNARPHDGALSLSPNGPFGSVRFTSYSVKFLDPDHSNGADLDGNGTVDLPNFTAPMNTVVDVHGESTGFILIISGGQKLRSPIWDLMGGGELSATASITFYGQEETSGEDIEIQRGLEIRIADFGDSR